MPHVIGHLKDILVMLMQGRPIYIQHLGAIHYKKLEAVTTEERMIKFPCAGV